MINDNRDSNAAQEIDGTATLAAIKDAGYAVKGWCRIKGFNYPHLYMTVHGLRGSGRRVAPKVDEIVEALKQDGFLRFKNVSNG